MKKTGQTASAQEPAVPSPRQDDTAAKPVPDAPIDDAPGKASKFWSVAIVETVMARWSAYNLAYHRSWTSVHGDTLYGFEMLYRATGDRRYVDFIKRCIDQRAATTIRRSSGG